MTPTSRRALAMPAIVAIAGSSATGPSAEADDSPAGHRRHDGPHGLVVRNTGPLVDLQPAAFGHYNVDPLRRSTPQTEVGLDLTVDDGRGAATASVPFVPPPARRSVVIHAEATDPGTGTAGPRLACLPVVW